MEKIVNNNIVKVGAILAALWLIVFLVNNIVKLLVTGVVVTLVLVYLKKEGYWNYEPHLAVVKKKANEIIEKSVRLFQTYVEK